MVFGVFYANAYTTTVNALVVPVNICNTTNKHVQKLDKITRWGYPSVKSMLDTCSHGKTSFKPVTLNMTVPVHDKKNRCPPSACDFVSWADQTDAWLATHTTFSKTPFTIYVIPEVAACKWAGMAYMGCASRKTMCRVWIHGDASKYVDTYIHEIGHNLGLSHAFGNGSEYGDASCAMGLCCWQRCFNAPHAEQLGWLKPLYVLNLVGTTPNIYTFDIPASRLKLNAFVRLHLKDMWVYLEYRKSYQEEGSKYVDVGLPATLSNAVNIYTTPKGNALGSITQYAASLTTTNELWQPVPKIYVGLINDIIPGADTARVVVWKY